VTAFIIDEIVIQIDWKNYYLWIAIEPVDKTILGIYIFQRREICLLLKNLFIHYREI
jgi:transposase-like protein